MHESNRNRGICLFSIWRRREFDLFSSGRWGICQSYLPFLSFPRVREVEVKSKSILFTIVLLLNPQMTSSAGLSIDVVSIHTANSESKFHFSQIVYCNYSFSSLKIISCKINKNTPLSGLCTNQIEIGEFACLVFEEGGNLTFFLVEGGEFAYGVGNLNFSFKHMCWIQNGVNDNGWVQVRRN
jgi:hypothetical protein